MFGFSLWNDFAIVIFSSDILTHDFSNFSIKIDVVAKEPLENFHKGNPKFMFLCPKVKFVITKSETYCFQITTLFIFQGHRFKKISIKTIASSRGRMIGHPINSLLNTYLKITNCVNVIWFNSNMKLKKNLKNVG